MTKNPISYRLTIPENYFVNGDDLDEGMSSNGTTLLSLWTIYPDFSGLSSLHYEEFYNKVTPNKSIKFHLEAVKPTTPDWGSTHLNAALNYPPGDFAKIRVLDENKDANGLVEYEFVNKPGRKAYSWIDNGAVTFVDCSRLPLCEVYKTWRGMLAVNYAFYQTEFSDMRELDRGLNELISSFRPIQIKK